METIYFDPGAASFFFLLAEALPPMGVTYQWQIADTNIFTLAGLTQDGTLQQFQVASAGTTTATWTRSDGATGTITVTTVAVTLYTDTMFQSIDDAENIGSFVWMDQTGPAMTQSFYSALTLLGTYAPFLDQGYARRSLYTSVITEIGVSLANQGLDSRDPQVRHLFVFIYYNVYKTGEHLVSFDEAKWAKTLSEAKTPVPNGASTVEEQAILADRESLRKAILQNYMGQTRYTSPVFALMRKKANLPGDLPNFVYQVLRARDSGQTIHAFVTSTGTSVAYSTAAFNEAQAMMQIPGAVAYVPFNPQRFMIAQVMIPVMSDGVTLTLGENPLVMGVAPEVMQYQMPQQNQPAGAFRRSLNSQRVIELADFDNQGRLVLFQLKGAGVPEYGFGFGTTLTPNDQFDPQAVGTYTGGEYLAPTLELDAMGLYDFGVGVFQENDIAPNMAGVALVTTQQAAFMADEADQATRLGAVSFRLEYSGGIRVFDVFSDVQNRIITLAQLFNLNLNPQTYPDIVAPKMMRHLVITNLLGMEYADSNVEINLIDLGVQGEFADSGALVNIDGPGADLGHALSVGIGSTLNRRGLSVRFNFSQVYCQQMALALGVIAGQVGQNNSVLFLSSAQSISAAWPINTTDTKNAFNTFCGYLRATQRGRITTCLAGFYAGGVDGYVTAVTHFSNNGTLVDALADTSQNLVLNGLNVMGNILQAVIGAVTTKDQALGVRMNDVLVVRNLPNNRQVVLYGILCVMAGVSANGLVNRLSSRAMTVLLLTQIVEALEAAAQ